MAENPLKKPPPKDVAYKMTALGKIADMVKGRREREIRELNEKEMERLRSQMKENPFAPKDPNKI